MEFLSGRLCKLVGLLCLVAIVSSSVNALRLSAQETVKDIVKRLDAPANMNQQHARDDQVTGASVDAALEKASSLNADDNSLKEQGAEKALRFWQRTEAQGTADQRNDQGRNIQLGRLPKVPPRPDIEADRRIQIEEDEKHARALHIELNGGTANRRIQSTANRQSRPEVPPRPKSRPEVPPRPKTSPIQKNRDVEADKKLWTPRGP